ncbi:sulfite oxidase heme-binding subunit YedZ [Gynuella sunshinyii]|uniref:Protein-methionine-sulfoxide reductase heme-binding subunit MsrQ n=1 Tax=Gynuella sunshinyii YC6258 TaxID=1445510 RepID=A0A0C5VRX5_9GAMM|nr:protein-methionine-sulfoxide reductase heme-binding subunit MsrQ [Gynuella sunshinyii]AJQ97392.1 putative membrane protein [Gynuella sunshinyii YC6258]
MLKSRWVKALLHIALLLPLLEECWQIWLLVNGMPNRLGPDPGKVILEDLATVAIWLLLLGLAITPAKQIFRINDLMRFRRMVGLYAFTYALLHLLSYLAFILGWDFSALWEDIIKRPYIIVGTLSLVILAALAATSYKAAMRFLGKRWKKLHQLVYPAVLLAILHEWWQAKEAFNEPLLHLVIASALLGYRLVLFFNKAFSGIKNQQSLRQTARKNS